MRQLRADLAKKKVTYYVDVKANTKPATADVRQWASTTLKKISATVPKREGGGAAGREWAGGSMGSASGALAGCRRTV